LAVGCRVKPRLLGALSAHPNQRAANAVRFQLLTGARIGEVLAARWSDLDLVRGVWIKPSHHTKQKRSEHLPLSVAALALLSEMRQRVDASERYLFPGDAPDKPLQGIKSVTKSSERSEMSLINSALPRTGASTTGKDVATSVAEEETPVIGMRSAAWLNPRNEASRGRESVPHHSSS
jgi:hypothetical protein